MKLNDAMSVPESIGEYAFEKFTSYAEYEAAARPALLKLLGIADMGELKSPNRLKPENLWKRDYGWATVEKLRFEYEPGEFGCCYLCIPPGLKKPYRLFMCLQGHSTGMHTSIAVKWEDETQPLEVAGDRDFAIQCAKRGYASLCVEQRYFGERSMNTDTHKPGCQVPMLQNLMVGRTAIGYRVFEIDCLIDYLKTRDDIDPDFMGITGNSGGGTTSMFAGAALTRLTHVMPSCAFSSFRGSIGAMKHCSCNYVPNLLFFGESADVVGLTAPRKLVIISGAEDPIFPLPEAKRQFARLQKIYAAAGAPDNLRHAVGPEGHRYYAEAGFAALNEIL